VPMKRPLCAVVLACFLASSTFAASREDRNPTRDLTERVKKVLRAVKLLPKPNADVLSPPKP
jgi:hypothetical protein